MTSILELLGLKQPTPQDTPGDTALVRIAQRAEGLDPERARLVAALATVLVRVARADMSISEVETARMVEIVRQTGDLSPDQARLVVDLALELQESQRGVLDYIATRELRRLAGPVDRAKLLSCLFAVTAADDSISSAEEEEVRQMASELGFEHRDYIAARSAFRDQREVLRGMPRRSTAPATGPENIDPSKQHDG